MTAPYRVTIDLAALVRNWRNLAKLAHPARCAAVVKADAYGTGIDKAVPALASAGCSTFFVATPDEGAQVRAKSSDAVVYVLDGLIGEPEFYRTNRLRPVLGCTEEWAKWAESANSAGTAAVHVDTGMNRLGFSRSEVHALADTGNFANAGIDLLISHLACADTPNHPLNNVQRQRFEGLRELFPGLRGSLSNSAGIFLGTDFHFDLVRPGIALYGGNSHPDAKMEPVVQAEAMILKIRQIGAGETVGYGAAQSANRDCRIAILAAGYADGIHRIAGSADGKPGASVAIAGHLAPLIGRISMDLIAVDVTDIPDDLASRGQFAELFGHMISVDDAATYSGTIGYELLTGLSRRAERRYIE